MYAVAYGIPPGLCILAKKLLNQKNAGVTPLDKGLTRTDCPTEAGRQLETVCSTIGQERDTLGATTCWQVHVGAQLFALQAPHRLF